MANITWQQVIGRIAQLKFVLLLDILVQHKCLSPMQFFTSLQDGISLVYKASKNGHKKILDLLLQAGADINLATTAKVHVSTVSSSVAAVIEVNVRLIEFVVCDFYFHQPHLAERKYALLDEFLGWMA